jgi:hypothetical protein
MRRKAVIARAVNSAQNIGRVSKEPMNTTALATGVLFIFIGLFPFLAVLVRLAWYPI